MKLFKRLILPFVLLCLFSQSHAVDIEAQYQSGVNATTAGQREKNIEDALKSYIEVENQMILNGDQKNGYLYFNIANCYYLRGELGLSILYYMQAKKLLPLDATIENNLNIALAKRVEPMDAMEETALDKLLFWHYSISEKRKGEILLISSLLFFLLCLVKKYKEIKGIPISLVLISFFIVMFWGSILSHQYFAPNYGVVIKETSIYTQPGLNYSLLLPQKANNGSRLKVISIQNDWYEVSLKNGQRGYVPKETFKVIM